MKKLFTFLALLLVGGFTFAQNVTVTFSVDLGAQVYRGLFNPATDSVVARGDFQSEAGLGNDWEGNLAKLLDLDGDTVYTLNATIPASFAGTTFNFKFVKLPDGWEADPNRTFTLAASGTQVLPTYWFNNDSSYVVETLVTNTLDFTADLTAIYGNGVGFFDPATDSIQVMGLDWDGLGTLISGNRRMVENPISPGVFTTSLTIKGPLGDSTKWKFKTFPDARFANTGWETGSDRWFTYVADGSTVDMGTIVPRIFPVEGLLTNDVNVLFQVDCNGVNGLLTNALNGTTFSPSSIIFVGYKGGSQPIGNWQGNWVIADTVNGYFKVMNDAGINGDKVAGDKVWSDTTIFWTGIGGGAIEFKFGAWYPGSDTANGGSTPLDNEGGFGENHIFFLRSAPTSVELRNKFGDFTTSLDKNENLVVNNFDLGQNYPNPFNPSTKINFAVPTDGIVTLKVFNVIGQEVATLVNGYQTKGAYTATFDASRLNTGVYFYTLTQGDYSATKKMILVK